jgi:hypothetical protein
MRIRFTRREVYETEGPGKGPVYEAGEVHDLRPDLAERWLRRDAAVLAPDEPAPPPAAEAPPAPPAPPARPRAAR